MKYVSKIILVIDMMIVGSLGGVYGTIKEIKALDMKDWGDIKALLPLPDGRVVSSGKDQAINIWRIDQKNNNNVSYKEFFSTNYERSDKFLEKAWKDRQNLSDSCFYPIDEDYTVETFSPTHPGDSGPIKFLALTDKETIVASSTNGCVSVLNLLSEGSSKKCLHFFNIPYGFSVESLSIIDGKVAMGSSLNRRIGIWKPESGDFTKICEYVDAVSLITLHEKTLVWGTISDSLDGKISSIQFCDLNSNKVNSVSLGTREISILAPYNSGKNNEILCGFISGDIEIWNLEKGNSMYSFKNQNESGDPSVFFLTQLPNDNIMSASKNNMIKIWDLKKKSPIETLSYQNNITAVAYAKNFLFVALGNKLMVYSLSPNIIN